MSDRRLLEPFCSLTTRPLHIDLKDRSQHHTRSLSLLKNTISSQASSRSVTSPSCIAIGAGLSKAKQSGSKGRSVISWLVVGLTIRLYVITWGPQFCKFIRTTLSGNTNEGFRRHLQLFLETFHVERWPYYTKLYSSSSNSWSQHHSERFWI
jgi:hypothetical protein